jgi:prevent-host-death family protein
MATIGLFEAKTKLSALVKRAEAGETFVITVHGRPVAQLGPTGEARRALSPDEAAAGLLSFRRAHRLAGISIRDLVQAGRKR